MVPAAELQRLIQVGPVEEPEVCDEIATLRDVPSVPGHVGGDSVLKTNDLAGLSISMTLLRL
jgi:hypothetical protein